MADTSADTMDGESAGAQPSAPLSVGPMSSFAFPSGETILFPVLGDPISQVRSPQKLTEILFSKARNAIVVPMHTRPKHLNGLLASLHCIPNIGGALITVPHKQDTFLACAEKSSRASFVEAVNVIRRTEEGWFGDNTDGVGYLNAIERKGFDVAGKRALLVGCGGAGSAIALEFLEREVRHLDVHDIHAVRRDGLFERLEKRFPGKIGHGSDDPSGYDVVANATPLGMKPDDILPVIASKLESWQFVACVVTKPEVPPLIEEARRRGCRTMTGADMFDAQADMLVDFLLSGEADYVDH